jgi:hypothetical protein
MPSGLTMRRTSVLTAASTLMLPIEMHLSVPWFARAP